MEINPAMLMLSAANPGLLPLALSGLGAAQNQAAAFSGYGGRMQHQHSGHIEHSAKPGMGEELRGIAVEPVRAFEAYQKALDAYGDLLVINCDLIARMDAEHKAESDEITQKVFEAHEARMKKWEARHVREVEIDARIQQLEDKKKNSFWGLDGFDKDELRKLNEESRNLLYDSMPLMHDYFPDVGIAPSLIIERERQAVKEAQAVASIAANLLHMSRAEVLQLHAMETGAWLATTKLAQFVTKQAKIEGAE